MRPGQTYGRAAYLRRTLFDVVVAGPLAGLVVAIPALLIGLRTSAVIASNAGAGPMMMTGASAGSSILLALLAKLSLGSAFEYGHVQRLSPLAFAGWLGLIVTALNLLPTGSLMADISRTPCSAGGSARWSARSRCGAPCCLRFSCA